MVDEERMFPEATGYRRARSLVEPGGRRAPETLNGIHNTIPMSKVSKSLACKDSNRQHVLYAARGNLRSGGGRH